MMSEEMIKAIEELYNEENDLLRDYNRIEYECDMRDDYSGAHYASRDGIYTLHRIFGMDELLRVMGYKMIENGFGYSCVEVEQ